MGRNKTNALLAIVLVAMLVVPGIAVGKGSGQDKDNGKGRSTQSAKKAAQGQASKSADKPQRKAAKTLKQEARKEQAAERKNAQQSFQPPAPGDPTSATAPYEPIELGKPSVGGAMVSITANLERALSKVAAGKKKQLPPGLVKVWQKFAVWLGIDPTTQPGYMAPSVITSPTAEPTRTVEPTVSVEPTPTDTLTTVDPATL